MPRQRNNRDENDQLKKSHRLRPCGILHSTWGKRGRTNCTRKTVISRQSRERKKQDELLRLQNHLKVDQGSKLISAYMVTDVAVHDSQELETLIDKEDAGQKLYGDATYIGQ